MIKGDKSREAIASLRGYAYQLYTTAIAWIELVENEILYLEVAEDYATVLEDSLQAVQVRDTRNSGNISINSKGVKDAIESIIQLQEENSTLNVKIRYLTTSEIALERNTKDRISNCATLESWNNHTDENCEKIRSIIIRNYEDKKKVVQFIEKLSAIEFREKIVSRIYWDCGHPNIEEIDAKFKELFIRFCKTNFCLMAKDSENLYLLVPHYILTTILESSSRELKLEDLKEKIKDWIVVGISKPNLDYLLDVQRKTGLESQNTGVIEPNFVHKLDPTPTARCVERKALEKLVFRSMQQLGYCILHGSKGTGKTSLAKNYVATQTDEWSYSFIRSDKEESFINKLIAVVREVENGTLQGLLIDGIDFIHSSEVLSYLSVLVTLLKNNNVPFLFISETMISNAVLSTVSLDSASATKVGNFSKIEISEVIATYGVSPSVWCEYVFLLSGGGLPLLVTALVNELDSKSWNIELLYGFDVESLSSIETERTAARNIICRTCSADEQSLLYRLSLVAFSFRKELVLAIAGISPKIENAVQSLDSQIGIWIDRDQNNYLSLSPLLTGSAESVFGDGQVESIHAAVSQHYVMLERLDITTIDALILHSINGRNSFAAAIFSMKVTSSSQEQLKVLASWMPITRKLSKNRLLFSGNIAASLPLRLMQLVLLSHNGDKVDALSCWLVLQSEIMLDDTEASRDKFELIALLKVLSIPASLIDIPNPMLQIERTYDLLCKYENEMSRFGISESKENVISVLFLNVVLTSVSELSLQNSLLDIESLNIDTKNCLFNSFGDNEYDILKFKLSVDSPPVLNEERLQILSNIKEIAIENSNEVLEMYCEISTAKNVYANDNNIDGALRSLTQLQDKYGNKTIIALEKVDLLSHNGSLSEAYQEAESADLSQFEDQLTRSIMSRETAILAAQLDDYSGALKHFERAYSELKGSEEQDVVAYSMGLRGDIAYTQFKLGNFADSINILGELLLDLNKTPDDSIQCRYVHHALRHLTVWMHSIANKKTAVASDGLPYQMYAGMCSDPSPSEKILEKDTNNLLIVGYILARTEIITCKSLNIANQLAKQLGEARHKVYEAILLVEKMGMFIESVENPEICDLLLDLLAAKHYIANMTPADGAAAMDSPLVSIPKLRKVELGHKSTCSDITEILRASLIAYFLKNELEQFNVLLDSFKAMLGETHPALLKFTELPLTVSDELNNLDFGYGCLTITAHNSYNPTDMYITSCNLVLVCSRNIYGRILLSDLCSWMKYVWNHQFECHRIGLIAPSRYLPESLLKLNKCDTYASLSSFILAARPMMDLANEQFDSKSFEENIEKSD